MGIDARMLVKIKFEPTDEQIARWSWDLVAATEPEIFFLQFGDESWATDHKPQRALQLSDNGAEYYSESKRAALPPNGKIYHQDGPDVLAEDGEWFLEVNLAGRYYGVGYERGNLPDYVFVAAWIEANIPTAEVWYGGDSSGVCVERFGPRERHDLMKHFLSEHGKDYYQGEMSRIEPGLKLPPPCGLCPATGAEFTQCGWGRSGNWARLHCRGCGRYFQTEDRGKTWKVMEEGEL